MPGSKLAPTVYYAGQYWCWYTRCMYIQETRTYQWVISVDKQQRFPLKFNPCGCTTLQTRELCLALWGGQRRTGLHAKVGTSAFLGSPRAFFSACLSVAISSLHTSHQFRSSGGLWVGPAASRPRPRPTGLY